ncbi:TPA: DUF1642 domain-containing protein [Streptococcus suis]|uniref:DUF1642 domain-containing protein n=2 Tax=Streptococcus suis TaxID=1307 RepID=UPI0009AAB71B|nr:DUF1642 domain-containing protein [Streptococcus suis]NQJ18303.1 DUF1642 domain-containing protein [Streptococcus suis]HEL2541517.1 DUF1642 domain-containing protein [Streptococcus suis]HEL2667309.1 DUF1642 domain-containing protein [Streptococcus suis]HEM4475528.1 DUF1642 domain-containing protein [Streptococcus suis]HEM6019362.1 DUF1642 domain-containing protein [Streptococcus suis]
MNKQEAIEIIEQDKMQVGKLVEMNSGAHSIQQKMKLVDYVPLEVVVNAINQIDEPQKVLVPAFIDSYIRYAKAEGMSLFIAMDNAQNKESEWIINNEETFARAWLDGYEVEQEKLYVVTDGNKLYLKEFDELNAIIIIDDVVGAVDYAKRYEDKTKAQQAADELGWIVKEVE